MNRRTFFSILCAVAIAAMIGAYFIVIRSNVANLPAGADEGPSPILPAPTRTFIPTVNIAPARAWPAGTKPIAASGLMVTAYASGLVHPRWLYVLPNGDVLVAETDAPSRPQEFKGIRGMVSRVVQGWAGAGVPSPNRITLLRDNGGGVVSKYVFLTGLNSPFGMSLVGNDLYVANTDAIVRFTYVESTNQITDPGIKIADLPAGPINHHWTKNLIASQDGSKLYATVGSNSNVGENGIDKEEDRAAILEIDRATGNRRVFASGLRNPNGMDWEPETGILWTVVNERDELGSDLVPDYLTSVKDGRFYGWPYSYYGQHVDPRVSDNRQMVAKAIVPDYAVGNHTAALGLIFNRGSLFPQEYRHGAFIGEHGSWNRRPLSGYKVIFVPFADGRPSGQPRDVLTGFLDKEGHALGRPVGVVIDKRGALLVADDVGNTVWRVSPAPNADNLTR